MGDVIALPFHQQRPGYDGLVCVCGEAWFRLSIVLDPQGTVRGHTATAFCVACGTAAPQAVTLPNQG